MSHYDDKRDMFYVYVCTTVNKEWMLGPFTKHVTTITRHTHSAGHKQRIV